MVSEPVVVTNDQDVVEKEPMTLVFATTIPVIDQVFHERSVEVMVYTMFPSVNPLRFTVPVNPTPERTTVAHVVVDPLKVIVVPVRVSDPVPIIV